MGLPRGLVGPSMDRTFVAHTIRSYALARHSGADVYAIQIPGRTVACALPGRLRPKRARQSRSCACSNRSRSRTRAGAARPSPASPFAPPPPRQRPSARTWASVVAFVCTRAETARALPAAPCGDGVRRGERVERGWPHALGDALGPTWVAHQESARAALRMPAKMDIGGVSFAYFLNTHAVNDVAKVLRHRFGHANRQGGARSGFRSSISMFEVCVPATAGLVLIALFVPGTWQRNIAQCFFFFF
ncbi:hypothetical protein BJV78DRAFT_1223614, partial [Lactifluus subvellereus]